MIANNALVVSMDDTVDEKLGHEIAKLNSVYGFCLDDERLDDWVNLFADDCVYKVWPRENFDSGSPLAWIDCRGKAMLRDRALCISEVNIYNIHYGRHFISNSVARRERDGAFRVRSNYMIAHTDNEGHSRIFSIGEYRDLIVESPRGLLFKEKVVIVDTFTVTSHVSIPL